MKHLRRVVNLVVADQLVLFDADDWRKILCMQYIGEDEGEERAFRDELSQMGIREEQAVLTGFYPDIKEGSWRAGTGFL